MDETRTVDDELRAIGQGVLDQAKRETDAGATPARILALGMACGAMMRMREDWQTRLTGTPPVRAEEAANVMARVALTVEDA